MISSLEQQIYTLVCIQEATVIEFHFVVCGKRRVFEPIYVCFQISYQYTFTSFLAVHLLPGMYPISTCNVFTD